MYFTQEDYKKIEKWLLASGVKDTQFPIASLPLNGNETIAFVQNGKNVKAPVKSIVDQLFLLGVSDFLNITDKYGESYITLEKAIQLIPYRSRKIGQVITFLDIDGNWNIYQFRGQAKNQWNNTTLWVDVIKSIIVDSILPDEEDLTGVKIGNNECLKFKNKDYNTLNFSGLGRVYMRKNTTSIEDTTTGEVKTINYLSQQAINKANTIYHIQYDYDLNGETITIPENCVLLFEGGSISNGTIVGTESTIVNSGDYIFIDIIISGTWKVSTIYYTWFKSTKISSTSNTQNIRNVIGLCDDNLYNNCYFNFSGETIEVELNSINEAVITLKSNTSIYIDGTIQLKNSDLTHYYIIAAYNKSNLKINGGVLLGDVETHAETGGEWGHGILIYNSSDIEISNLTSSKFWGDGINVNSTNMSTGEVCMNINIHDVIIDSCRRQGISIGGCVNGLIERCTIQNIGAIKATPPTSGIDLEPNDGNTCWTDVIINNCTFNNIKGQLERGILLASSNPNNRIEINNCELNSNICLAWGNNLTVRDCSNIWNVIVYSNINSVLFENCDIFDPSDAASYYGSVYQNGTYEDLILDCKFNKCTFKVKGNTSTTGNSFVNIVGGNPSTPIIAFSFEDCIIDILDATPRLTRSFVNTAFSFNRCSIHSNNALIIINSEFYNSDVDINQILLSTTNPIYGYKWINNTLYLRSKHALFTWNDKSDIATELFTFIGNKVESSIDSYQPLMAITGTIPATCLDKKITIKDNKFDGVGWDILGLLQSMGFTNVEVKQKESLNTPLVCSSSIFPDSYYPLAVGTRYFDIDSGNYKYWSGKHWLNEDGTLVSKVVII